MIKIENTEVIGWEAAIRGMRNPMNSWEKSDSSVCAYSRYVPHCKDCEYVDSCNPEEDMYKKYIVGPNDHDLMMRLAKGGSVHAKYRRMIVVYADITAPLYWWAEADTYKVGTVRNSCSFMHKGTAKEFDIKDFSVKDERIYGILSPLTKKSYELDYPYKTGEFRIFTDRNGRTYKVYKNGYVLREAFDYVDSYGTGRTRHFDEAPATLYQNRAGYYCIKLSGRNGGHMLLHRMVASVWCDKKDGCTQVNHIDGNKGNNSAENLEWVTPSENMQKGIETDLYDNLSSLHHRYRIWKNSATAIPPEKRLEFSIDVSKGLSHKELAEKYDITPNQANNSRYIISKSENEDLFQECYLWEQLIEHLNYLRSLYLETKDEQIFQEIRCLLPQGYLQKSTVMLNYEVLAGIYTWRKDHKLDEWRDLCRWIESLPYSEIITLKESEG